MRWIYVAVPLILILAGSIWFAGMSFTLPDGDAMPASGYYAMAGGILFSLVIGCGLMALVFYSARRGYDDAANGDAPREDH